MLFDLHPKEQPNSMYGKDDDLAMITDHLSQRRWITILGPRMVGKTSLAKAAGFLNSGFKEYRLSISPNEIDEVFSRFGGIPGWLTLYGNNVVVSKMSHRGALRKTEKEAFVTARQTLERYFAGRNRREHLTALKAIAIGARWSEIRSVLETNLGKKMNDGSLKNIIDALQASYLVKKRDSTYYLIDPVIQRLLYTGKIK